MCVKTPRPQRSSSPLRTSLSSIRLIHQPRENSLCECCSRGIEARDRGGIIDALNGANGNAPISPVAGIPATAEDGSSDLKSGVCEGVANSDAPNTAASVDGIPLEKLPMEELLALAKEHGINATKRGPLLAELKHALSTKTAAA